MFLKRIDSFAEKSFQNVTLELSKDHSADSSGSFEERARCIRGAKANQTLLSPMIIWLRSPGRKCSWPPRRRRGRLLLRFRQRLILRLRW